jgi:hypothetical protein
MVIVNCMSTIYKLRRKGKDADNSNVDHPT